MEVAVSVPEVPVMVTVSGPPVVAVLLAASVSTLEFVVVGLGLNEAVTPLGKPLALRVTPPVNPLEGVTVMVSVALLPCTTVNVPVAGAMAKLGAKFTVREMVEDAVRLPEVPVMVTVAAPVVAVLLAVRVRRHFLFSFAEGIAGRRLRVVRVVRSIIPPIFKTGTQDDAFQGVTG